MSPTPLELQLRTDCYVARRIIRADSPATRKRILRPLDSQRFLNVTELADALRPLLLQHCVAKAEALAIRQVLKQRGVEGLR